MPAITKCPVCGFEGNHGFVGVVGGLHFYHTIDPNAMQCMANSCGFYLGASPARKTYRTALELFAAEVEPVSARSARQSDRVWAQAWRARLTGHERKAKRLFAQWTELHMARK